MVFETMKLNVIKRDWVKGQEEEEDVEVNTEKEPPCDQRKTKKKCCTGR